MAFLTLSHVGKTYGKGDTAVHALQDVSFTVEKGEFVAIVGASGSGKSTLLHLIGGADRGDGEITLEENNVFSMKDKEQAIFRRRKVGFVFQEYNLIPILTVEENIQIPVRLDGKKMEQEYLEELLGILGLEERRHHLPEQLSGGQKQRVAIGRALANHPALLLADEPTGNLDKQNGMEIMRLLIQSAKQFSQTLLLVTHDPEIAQMADRIITISDGKVQSDEKVEHPRRIEGEQIGGDQMGGDHE